PRRREPSRRAGHDRSGAPREVRPPGEADHRVLRWRNLRAVDEPRLRARRGGQAQGPRLHRRLGRGGGGQRPPRGRGAGPGRGVLMRAFLMPPTVRRGAQIVCGLIFLAAALPKIADLTAFAGNIHNFHLEPIVPVAATNLLAVAIPWIELVAGLALVTGVRPRARALVDTLLLAAFTAAVGGAGAAGRVSQPGG